MSDFGEQTRHALKTSADEPVRNSQPPNWCVVTIFSVGGTGPGTDNAYSSFLRLSDVPLGIRGQHEPAAAGKEFVCVTIAFTLSNLALQPPEKK
jgi:hypothetical protein